MKIKRKLTSLLAVSVLSSTLLPSAFAQSNPAEINAAIRREGMENSKVMNTIHVFTDVFGPRLTGSPNLVNAAKWGAAEMKRWGFDSAELEPWEFGHMGWVNEMNSGRIFSPVQDTLTYEVLAWTPSTKGVVRSDVVSFVIPTFPSPENEKVMQPPTQAELTAYFDSMKATVTGKAVLMGKPAVIPVTINPAPRRISDEDAKRRYDPANPVPQGPPAGFTPPAQVKPREGALSGLQIAEQVDKFLVDNNVALRINDAAMDHGLMRAFNNRTFDPSKVVPTVVMRNEDFGRMYRLIHIAKLPVKVEFEIKNRIIPDGVTGYNMIGEIWGSDKKDEVVMLGGHLDSWHAATGATDNAAGCATMMEAARILKAIGVKPRRTIRVACWSGEEQGLLGSLAYVKRHFGTAENPTPNFDKFNGYFNIDSGTGRARGMSVFGPPEAASPLRSVLAPFADLGFAGVLNGRSRNIGGSDHTSFNNAGLPGIGVAQDPIEYFTTTWHTNLDTYERIIESDVKSSAVIIAAAVYHLAMSEEKLPRYSKDAMPKAP
ncbi:MAG: M20/M25/M40 family metallo-hydrolase [Blastocatellia bacterium]|nr:M20/M25/M40 family metallo-hydrolase [Blastocatellia bacterium]